MSTLVTGILRTFARLVTSGAELALTSMQQLAVSSEPSVALEAVDLSTTDATFSAGQEPRALWCDAAGTIKVDGYTRTGTAASTGITITTSQAGPVPIGRITKVYKTGTSVNVIALW